MDTFENVLGQFENSEVNPFFWNFSTSRPSRVQWTKKFQWNHLKTCLDTLRNVFGHFWNFKLFSIFFSNFSKFRPFRVHWSIILTKKNYLKTCSKRVWTFWGTFLGILKKNESFSIFLVFFHVSTLQGALGKTFSEKYLKTSSKLVWKLLRTFWIILGIQIFSILFSNFWSPGCTGQEKFGKNHLRRNLDTFGNVFRDFENFFSIFWNFSISLPSRVYWASFFTWKNCRSMLKTSLNTFGNVFGHFENWKFSSFLKFFPVWTFQGAQGNFFRENYLKTSLKFVWTLLGSFLDTFEISNFCRFFFRISRKNYLEACSKRVWTFLGTYLGFLKKNESFSIFLRFFQVSTLQRALGKNFFPKNTSKQVRNLFGNF